MSGCIDANRARVIADDELARKAPRALQSTDDPWYHTGMQTMQWQVVLITDTGLFMETPLWLR